MPTAFAVQPPFLAYSDRRPPFHDGMDEEHARIEFDCRACGATIAQNVLACLCAGDAWYENLTQDNRSEIARAFGYRMQAQGPEALAHARFPNGRRVHFCTAACPRCAGEYALAIDFHERQPTRYIGVLQGVACMASSASGT